MPAVCGSNHPPDGSAHRHKPSLLDHAPHVHHRHAVEDIPSRADVEGNENHLHAQLALLLAQQPALPSASTSRRKLPRMRLSPFEQSAIAEAAHAVLPAGSRVLLFGSRTDDTRRGGDIDLLVEPPAPVDTSEESALRSRLTVRLYRLIGERRIDIVVAPAGVADDRLVIAEARRHAIELVQT